MSNMKRLKNLNEAHAIVKQAQNSLRQVQKLKLSLKDNVSLNDNMIKAIEALEFLRIQIQSMALQEKIKRGKS